MAPWAVDPREDQEPNNRERRIAHPAHHQLKGLEDCRKRDRNSACCRNHRPPATDVARRTPVESHELDLAESDGQRVPTLAQNIPLTTDGSLPELDAQFRAPRVDLPYDPTDAAERTRREIHDIARPIVGKPHGARVIHVSAYRRSATGPSSEESVRRGRAVPRTYERTVFRVLLLGNRGRDTQAQSGDEISGPGDIRVRHRKGRSRGRSCRGVRRLGRGPGPVRRSRCP